MLIDGNSIGFANQRANRLTYNGQEVQALYGVIRTLKKLKQENPFYQQIVLWDGHSWRYDTCPDYKANRKDAATLIVKSHYTKQMPAIKKAISLLGIQQITIGNLEADDLAAVFTNQFHQQGKKVMLVSGDKDWLQLVREGVFWYDPIRDRRCNHLQLEALTGCKNVKQFQDFKCLTGDTSDNIKGVGMLGDNRALQLFSDFGDVETFLACEFTDEQVKEFPKYLSDFYTNRKGGRDKYYANKKLMVLDPSLFPKAVNVVVEEGKRDFEAFELLCMEHGFASIRREMLEFIGIFGEQ